MGEQIRQAMAVMGILTTDAQPMMPPASLKKKIHSAFEEDKNSLLQSTQKNIIQLDNWFQELFDQGWQTVSELIETPTVAPAFRNSGVEGARTISLGTDNAPIVLIVRVKPTSTYDRDIVVEILPQLEHNYLPTNLQLILLDADGETVMKANTRQENKNLKFDFSGTSGEVFGVKLELFDDSFQENFLL